MNKDNKKVGSIIGESLERLNKKANPVDIAGIGVSDPYPKIDFDKVDALVLWAEKNLKNDMNVFATYLEKLEDLSGAELRLLNRKMVGSVDMGDVRIEINISYPDKLSWNGSITEELPLDYANSDTALGKKLNQVIAEHLTETDDYVVCGMNADGSLK